MPQGLDVELNELIDLKRYADSSRYKPTARGLRLGGHLSTVRGRGMDFAEVRHYQAGDEVRHMEWRVTARTGKPHVKLYHEARERPVVILVDLNPSMYFGTRIAFKSVVAARLAALIAWTVVKQGDRVGGLIFNADKHNDYEPRAREQGVLRFLSTLSDYSKEEQTDFSKARSLTDSLTRIRRVTRPGSLIVLISDFYQWNEEAGLHLRRLRAHNDIVAYPVCDALELAPPKPGQYAVSNGHEEAILDTNHNSVTRAYQAYCSERLAEIQTQLQRWQIQWTPVTASDDLSRIVRQTFPRRSGG